MITGRYLDVQGKNVCVCVCVVSDRVRVRDNREYVDRLEVGEYVRKKGCME